MTQRYRDEMEITGRVKRGVERSGRVPGITRLQYLLDAVSPLVVNMKSRAKPGLCGDSMTPATRADAEVAFLQS
jgi:hypothetical protein